MAPMDETAVFRLFACCVPVRGARRSTLCDLQRGALHLIPNGLHEILTEHQGRTVGEIVAHYGEGSAAVVGEYFQFLLENELGFWCDDPDAFPELELSYEVPERVTHAIVDVGESSRHDYARIFAQLDDLGCKALQLRFFRASSPAELEGVLALTARGRLRAVELLLKDAPHWTPESLERLCFAHPRISSVVVHSAPAAAEHRARPGALLTWTEQAVDSASHCGEVHPGYFVVSLDAFTEARRFNSCLNGKIAVDEHGEIRNCPSMPRSYGHHATVSLHAALAQASFRELWEVNKDQVETCRDCEFRYVCTDCRAYVRPGEERHTRPSTCTYDPYTATWN